MDGLGYVEDLSFIDPQLGVASGQCHQVKGKRYKKSLKVLKKYYFYD
jgi:hypothetical protein